MNIITVDCNKTLNKEQIYELTKFLFLIGANIFRDFNPNGKRNYFIQMRTKTVHANSIEKAMRLFIKEITQPNFTMLSNNWKRKLAKIMR